MKPWKIYRLSIYLDNSGRGFIVIYLENSRAVYCYLFREQSIIYLDNSGLFWTIGAGHE